MYIRINRKTLNMVTLGEDKDNLGEDMDILEEYMDSLRENRYRISIGICPLNIRFDSGFFGENRGTENQTPKTESQNS